MYHDITKTKN
jgi:hypothetical protein